METKHFIPNEKIVYQIYWTLHATNSPHFYANKVSLHLYLQTMDVKHCNCMTRAKVILFYSSSFLNCNIKIQLILAEVSPRDLAI